MVPSHDGSSASCPKTTCTTRLRFTVAVLSPQASLLQLNPSRFNSNTAKPPRSKSTNGCQSVDCLLLPLLETWESSSILTLKKNGRAAPGFNAPSLYCQPIVFSQINWLPFARYSISI